MGTCAAFIRLAWWAAAVLGAGALAGCIDVSGYELRDAGAGGAAGSGGAGGTVDSSDSAAPDAANDDESSADAPVPDADADAAAETGDVDAPVDASTDG